MQRFSVERVPTSPGAALGRDRECSGLQRPLFRKFTKIPYFRLGPVSNTCLNFNLAFKNER
jgi:hypothetical protein